jgi:predicted phosphodiesterase
LKEDPNVGEAMKTVGIISDIHANTLALEAVMEELEDAERIFCLGDLVGIGPRPMEVVDSIRGDPRISSVMGNHDHNTVYGTELGPIRNFPRKPHHDWVRSRLGHEQMEYLAGLPLHLKVDIGGVVMAIMHRHPADCGSPVPYFDDPRREVVENFYQGVEGDLLFFGHTHVPLDVTGKRRYMNPGAVGAENMGRARFIRIDLRGDDHRIVPGRVRYDLDAVVSDMEAEEVPYRKFIEKRFFSHDSGY